MHIAILGLGPSLEQYVDLAKRLGGRRAYCDQTWGINAVGSVIECDRVFHMDDVRIQQIRAEARPESNIARMLDWLRTYDRPVVTSRAHPDYPCLEEFPLDAALNMAPQGYFNSTAAYAAAYALLQPGLTKLSVFGCDYTYPNAHDAEKGRACLEYWLGMAAARGVQLVVPKVTSLLDALYAQAERFYGYDTVDLRFHRDDGDGGDGRIHVERLLHDRLPTAEEIEARYDHSQHPNPLVSGGN